MGCTSSKDAVAKPMAPGEFKKSGNSTTIQPYPGYVIKTKSLASDEKLFINVFHHFMIEDDHYPIKDRITVTDKKGEQCIAYGIVIPTVLFERGEENLPSKEETVKKVMQVLHNAYPAVRFDVSNIKLPKMKKGYVGDDQSGDDNNRSDIPLFTIVSKKTLSNKGNNEPSSVPPAASTGGPTVAAAAGSTTVPSQSIPAAGAATTTAPASSSSSSNLNTNNGTVTLSSGATVTLGGPSNTVSNPSTPPPASAGNNSNNNNRNNATAATTTPPTAPNSTNVTPTTPLTAASLSARNNNSNGNSAKDTPSPTALPRRPSVGTMGGGRQSIVVLPGPPKMVGWLRKQGHVVRNWKQRYFVLNNGYMTYYVDKSDKPPFGKDAKGQLCLAGFRMVTGIDGSSRSSMMSNSPASKEVTSSNNRILLKFDATLLDPEMVTYLRKAGSSSTSNNTDDHASEMLLEASNAEERERWIAAIENHTLYIETASVSSYNKTKETYAGGSGGMDYDDVEIQFQAANDFSSEANNTIIDNSQDATELRAEQDSVRRASFSTTKTSTTVNGSSQRRQSQIKSSLNNINSQKWTVYVERYEDIVTSGVTSKPNPLGVIYLVRELILVRTDPSRLPESSKGKPYTYKRLLYVDTNSYDMRGEIRWQTDSKKNPTCKKVDDKCFEISDAKRLYFYPKDGKSVDEWVESINSISQP